MNYPIDTDILELMLNDYGVLHQPFIRPVRSLEELRAVYRLTHDCYAASGFCAPNPTQFIVHYPQYDHIQETTILVALSQGRVVGSVSVTMDGPKGLTVDKDFNSECL